MQLPSLSNHSIMPAKPYKKNPEVGFAPTQQFMYVVAKPQHAVM